MFILFFFLLILFRADGDIYTRDRLVQLLLSDIRTTVIM